MHLLTIRLAGEPRGKGRPRFVRATGRTYTDGKTASFENALRMAAQDAMGERVPFKGPLELVMTARFPVPASMSKKDKAAALAGLLRPAKKPDCDNLAKTIDALNGIAFDDDRQVVQQNIGKWYSAKPELLIELRTPETGGLL